MSRYGVHICSFSALDDIPKRKHRDRRVVLAALKKAGRFSGFEVTETQALARSVTALQDEGLIVTTPLQFPWSKVEVTAKGEAFLAQAPIQPGRPARLLVRRVDKSGLPYETHIDEGEERPGDVVTWRSDGRTVDGGGTG